MKTIRVQNPGGREVLRYEDVPEPQPKKGEALVKLEAIGVNFVDVYYRTGAYKTQAPFTLGVEGAGKVIAVGPEVTQVKVGDRVAYTGVLGSYAELAVVPVDRLVLVPAQLSAKDAAAAMLQGMTAHYLATSTYPVRSGDRCLVHAAAGGVGRLLSQIAKMRGAEVIGTVSTEEKAKIAQEAGVAHIIFYVRQDFEEEVRKITGGQGVQVVYDSVGETTFAKGLNCLTRRGMMALFGQSSGPVKAVDPQVLNQKGSLFLTRPSLAHYTATRAELESRSRDVFDWIIQGKLKLRIGVEFPLKDAAEAHRQLEARLTTGKILLIP
jgi:NADPH2:quinone reductase